MKNAYYEVPRAIFLPPFFSVQISAALVVCPHMPPIYGKFQMKPVNAYSNCVRMSKSVWYAEEIQQDATVCRYLFTAKFLYMFRASIAPIIGST